MKDVFLPHWLTRFFFFNPYLFNIGHLAGFLALGAISYKIKQTRPKNEFSKRLLLLFYCGMFENLANALFGNPYYTHIFSTLLAIPKLIAVLYFALFMIKRYGIGGDK